MPLDLDAFRLRLEADLARLDDAIAQAETAAGTVTLDQSSVGRLSRMDAMQQQAIAHGMTARLQTQKRKLRAALARIGAGSFGRCCQCDAELGAERLHSDPAAVFCPECMAERESAGDRGGRY